jgi:hypothetical protein
MSLLTLDKNNIGEVLRRIDADAQFQLIGALCAMRDEGQPVGELVEFCLTEIMDCVNFWPSKEKVVDMVALACEAGYFDLKDKL